jgi:hypothetical protein
MTRYLDALLVLLASVVVHAIPYDGPVATPVLQRFADNGWTPKPTTAPRPLLELFKRQEDPGFCGYLEGDGGMCSFPYMWFFITMLFLFEMGRNGAR